MSVLFPLSLRGFGTHDVESISSYAHQLATIHHVSVNRLLERSFGWYLEKYNDVSYHELRACGNITYLSRPKESTEDLIKVLAYITGEQNLRSGTFLATHRALDRAVGQFASHMRWCPSCMYEFEVAGDPGYFKLIWSFLGITHCPEHRVVLIDKCSECDSHQDGFGKKNICRICQNCGVSLGKHAKAEEIIPSWELKGMDLIRLVDKIAKNPTLSYPENGIRNLMTSIFDKAWDLHEEELLWSKLPPDEYLGLTCGNTTVSLQIARRFSARLGVELHDLLMGEIESLPGVLEPEWFKYIPEEYKPKRRNSRHDRDEIYTKLLEFLSEQYADTPLPFSQVAKLIGISKGYLEHHFSEVCGKITERYSAWKDKNKLMKRREARLEVLKYFDTHDSIYEKFSRKHALREIRQKTGLPKNMLREEISAIYKLLFNQ